MGIGRKHDRTKLINSFLLKMGLKAKLAVSVLSPWPCLFSPPELAQPWVMARNASQGNCDHKGRDSCNRGCSPQQRFLYLACMNLWNTNGPS